MRKTVLAITLAALLSGCRGPVRSREADRLLTVQTLGCDPAPGGALVSLSAPAEGEDGQVMRLTGLGETLERAVADAQLSAPREELLFSHIRYAAVGEAAARSGLAPVLDWFERSPQTRLDQPLLVVRGGEARELIAGSADPAFESGGVLAALEREALNEGAPPLPTLLTVARGLAERGTALCFAVALRSPDQVLSAEDGAVSAVPAGWAVFRDGALRGYLDGDAARGAELLLGGGPGMSFVLRKGEDALTVRLREFRVDLSAPDRDTLVIGFEARAAVTEQEGREDPADPQWAAALAEHIAALLGSAAEAELLLETDFLDLEKVLGAPPAPGLQVSAAGECRIDRSFDLSRAAPVAGEAGLGG